MSIPSRSSDSPYSPFNHRLVSLIVDRPWWALLLGFLLLASALGGLSRVQADFSHRGFFWDNDPHLMRFDAFERRFGNDDVAVLALHSPSGIFDMDSAQAVVDLTERMWQIPEVIRVDSLSNFIWVRAQDDDILVEPLFPEQLNPEVLAERRAAALAHEVIPDYLLSRDGRTTLIFAQIKPGLDQPSDSPLVYHSMLALAEEFRQGDHVLHVSGSPAVIASFAEVAGQDTARIFLIALLVAALALGLLLRSISGVLLPLGLMLLCVPAAFGVAGWAGLTLNNLSSAVPSIVLAISIAHAVHLLATFNEARRNGVDKRAALRHSLSKNLLPTFLTSLTTALGFASFALVEVRPIAALGTMMSISMLLIWLLCYLLLGAALSLLPARQPAVDARLASRDLALATRFVDALIARRALIMIAALVFTVLAVALSTRNQVNSDPFKYFASDVPLRVANEFIEAQVGGARGIEVVVEAGREDGIKDPQFLARVERLQNWIAEQPQVTRVVSILDALKATHRALHGDEPEHYRLADEQQTIAQELFLYQMNLPQGMDLNDRVTLANDALRLSVLWTVPNSAEVIARAAQIEAKAAEFGLDAQVTGKYFLFDSMNGYVVPAFLQSFGIAVLTVALVILIALRSPRLMLISLIPNLLPVLAGGAFLYLLGQPLDIGTVIVASVCLGIAVDDTIHVLSHYRYQIDRGLAPRAAVIQTLANTARPLLMTTLILSGTFFAFLTADFTPNLYFGLLTGSILVLALLLDLTLTPLLLIGKQRTASARDPQTQAHAA